MSQTYNPLDQLAKLTDTYQTSGGQATHLSYTYTYNAQLPQTLTDQTGDVTTYTYDALNRLTDASTTGSDGATGYTTTYAYDALGRLDQADTAGPSDYAYTLDGDGNITRIDANGTSTSYAYNPGNEICWSYAGASTAGCSSPPTGANGYSYGPDGNQTSNGNGLTATYNPIGQTTSITRNATTTDYSYLGATESELISEGSATLHEDILGVAGQTTGSNTTYYSRTLTGRQVDERTTSATYDYLYDPNGSVIGLVDSKGHLVDQYAYDPYGNQTTLANQSPTRSATTTPTTPSRARPHPPRLLQPRRRALHPARRSDRTQRPQRNQPIPVRPRQPRQRSSNQPGRGSPRHRCRSYPGRPPARSG